MIAVLYGRDFAPFAESAVYDICAAAEEAGGSVRPLSLEAALADPMLRGEVRRLYVLPFDPPKSARIELRAEPIATFLKSLFPRVEIVNSLVAHELCWDKLDTEQRLVNRGVPVPDTLVTSEPAEVYEFVRQHDLAILKQRSGCGGQGHIVVWIEDGRLMGDAGSRPYEIDLAATGQPRLLAERLSYPAPFYLQRLLGEQSGGEFLPGQMLRAYVIDGQIGFWTERYRDHYRRPSDWIINIARGAKYRFVLNVSEEAKKLALRAADVVGARVAAVDILRSSAGLRVLEVDTDGYHMMIDRQFKLIPDYRGFFNLDRFIAEALLAEPAVPVRRVVEPEESAPRSPRPRSSAPPARPRRPGPMGRGKPRTQPPHRGRSR